jgi:hypothetical protein
MQIPDKYRDIILSDIEPGQAYRKCLALLAEEPEGVDYDFTEAIVYGTEVRYAIDILTKGRPERIWNFGDLVGDAETRLWAILDRLDEHRIAFVGSGPYPVTALLLRERYADAEIVCIENNIAAHFLGEAVFDKLGTNVTTRFAEAIDIDYEPFTAVIIAAMVSGKQILVDKILRSSQALIIARGSVESKHDRLIQFDSTFGDDGALTGGAELQ